MYTVPPKKMIIINILDILKKYSDSEHRLTQQDIIKKLASEYNMKIDRKSVKRNLMNLIDMGYDIEYEEIAKKDPDGEESSIMTNWYINHEFDDSELRLLIDSLLFSKHIPYSQCKALVDKLKGLGSVYFDKKVDFIRNLPENEDVNKELFYTIDMLEEAIRNNRQVSFVYNAYGSDKKLHPRRDRRYTVSPYQMAATNGRYYLMCKMEEHEGCANYRIDRITDIKITDKKRERQGVINLPRHMAEHIYMYSGESERVKFKAKNYIIDQIIDWFGKEVVIEELGQDECRVTVYVNTRALFQWALQYGMHVEVLEPIQIRNDIKTAIKAMAEKYA